VRFRRGPHARGSQRPKEVVIRYLRADKTETRLVAERGIKAVPAATVDGRLLDCCNGSGSDCDELMAAGVGQPRA